MCFAFMCVYVCSTGKSEDISWQLKSLNEKENSLTMPEYKISRAYSPLLQKNKYFMSQHVCIFDKVKCSSSKRPQVSVLLYYQEQPQGRSFEISLHSFVFYLFSA